MLKKVVIATRNKGKLKEMTEILNEICCDIISMEQAGIDKDIEETGNSFEENALIKAQAVADITREMVIADDSGLEVDFLGGAPGIYSSRFAGEGASDHDRNSKLLAMLEGVPAERRTARFVCAIAVVVPGGGHFTVRGTCEGRINFTPSGENGFGYDPLFFLQEYNMTMAQLSAEEKNKISHRGKALKLMVKELRKRLQ